MQLSTPQRPRTRERFVSLMELYERNYMLLRLLAPALRSMPAGDHLSQVSETVPLELAGLRQERYTSTFRLTYRLSERYACGMEPGREPNLAIRLYHDARTCEVMSGLLPGETREVRRTRDLAEGHRLNAFLNRWLAYCLRQGHGFEGSRRGRQRGAEPAALPERIEGVGGGRRSGSRSSSPEQ